MVEKKRKNKKIKPGEHLEQNLKSSYGERLDWLEKAHRIVSQEQVRNSSDKRKTGRRKNQQVKK